MTEYSNNTAFEHAFKRQLDIQNRVGWIGSGLAALGPRYQQRGVFNELLGIQAAPLPPAPNYSKATLREELQAETDAWLMS